jgi:hypothetical protein
MDCHKLVQIFCRCELGKGVSVVVTDQGQGFDPSAVPDPTAAENINNDHGRGIWVMKSMMDEVSFERGGTEVRMRKAPIRSQEWSAERQQNSPSARQTGLGTPRPLSPSERANSLNKRG